MKVRGAPTAHKVVLVSASTTIMRVKLKNPRRRSEENKVHDSFGRLTKIVTVEVGRWGVGREVVGSPKHGTVEVVEVGSPKQETVEEVVKSGSSKQETVVEVGEVSSPKQETVEAVGVGVGSPKQETVRRRRKGGKGSRFRSLLVFQRRLSADRGLPPSRLIQETEARSPRRRGRREEEESASPILRRGVEDMVNLEEELGEEGDIGGGKEEVGDTERRALSGDLNRFSTPSSSSASHPSSSSHSTMQPQVFQQASPFSHLTPAPTPPFSSPYNPPFTPPFSSPYTLHFTPFTPVTPFTPLQSPECGLQPGPTDLCGRCGTWGTIIRGSFTCV